MFDNAKAKVSRNVRSTAAEPKKRGRKPPPENETARERFLRLANPRMAKAVKEIRKLANFARGDYEWDDRDVAAMSNVLRMELEETIKAFSRGKSKKQVPTSFFEEAAGDKPAFEVAKSH